MQCAALATGEPYLDHALSMLNCRAINKQDSDSTVIILIRMPDSLVWKTSRVHKRCKIIVKDVMSIHEGGSNPADLFAGRGLRCRTRAARTHVRFVALEPVQARRQLL